MAAANSMSFNRPAASLLTTKSEPLNATALAFRQQTQEWGGLAQTPRSSGAALQEFSEFNASERVENASPLEKDRSDAFAVPCNPALQVAPSPLNETRIAPQPARDQAIRRRVHAVDGLMVP